MEHRDENVFRWSKDNDYCIFPIDYSETELEPLLHKSSYKIEKYLLDNPVLQPILTDLLFAEGKMHRQSESNIPIPLEAVYFLCCFDELGIGNNISYEEFEELCNKLCKGTSPACTDDKIFSTFYRHMLFQNTSYCEVVLKDLWEKELTPRFLRLKELAGQTGFYEQIQVLIDCLQSLDRCTLNMELHPRIELPKQTPEAAVQNLLSQLLSERKKIPYKTNVHVDYLVNNSQLASGQSMKDAFYELRRSKSSRDKILQDARETYFNDLAKQIETRGTAITTSSLQLEQKYEFVQNYLRSVNIHITEAELFDAVNRICIQECRKVIDFCVGNPRRPPAGSQQKSYIDSLIYYLVSTKIHEQLSVFQETIQLICFHSTLYQGGKVQELHYSIIMDSIGKKVPIDKNALKNLFWFYECPINPPYDDLCNFAKHFEQAWGFIYEDSPFPFNKESRMFIDRDRVTAQLFNEGNRAAETFGATQWAYTSLEEIGSLIGQYQTLIYYPQYCYSPVLYWEVISKLLQTIFLIVLNKIIENVTPAVISNLKHLDNIVAVIIP